jgi:hypothetical protein
LNWLELQLDDCFYIPHTLNLMLKYLKALILVNEFRKTVFINVSRNFLLNLRRRLFIHQ